MHEEVKFNSDGNFTTKSIKKHAVGVYLVKYAGPISNLQQEWVIIIEKNNKSQNLVFE